MSNAPITNSRASIQTSEPRFTPIRIAGYIMGVVGIIASLIAGLLTDPPTLWGLLPIVLFSALVVMGINMIEASVFGIVSAFFVLLPPLSALGTIALESVQSQVTLIGVIIMLGGGVGEVLRRTRVADMIVRGIIGLIGGRGRTITSIAVMLACLVLVAVLGTLAGALAIAAPLVIPVAARLGFTRSATAAMMFVGGCAGLALAPFAGSNVAIMSAVEASYLEYLLYGALPLAVVSLIAGVVVVAWMQKRTQGTGDDYSAEDAVGSDFAPTRAAVWATAVFGLGMVAAVVGAILLNLGLMFPLLALPVLGIVTGLVGGLGVTGTVRAIIRGAWGLIGMFGLFVLLAIFFVLFESLHAFDVVLDLLGGGLGGLSPFLFAVVVALLGWVGIPGATAAQVVLLDQVFGELAGSLGITMGTWIIVLLFASKADTYGPFPNANMVGAMGLARSTNLKNILITGWAVLIPACIVYLIMMFFQTL